MFWAYKRSWWSYNSYNIITQVAIDSYKSNANVKLETKMWHHRQPNTLNTSSMSSKKKTTRRRSEKKTIKINLIYKFSWYEYKWNCVAWHQRTAKIIAISRTNAFVSLRTHSNNKYGLGLKYRGSANYTNKTCSRKASDERMSEAGGRANERASERSKREKQSRYEMRAYEK